MHRCSLLLQTLYVPSRGLCVGEDCEPWKMDTGHKNATVLCGWELTAVTAYLSSLGNVWVQGKTMWTLISMYNTWTAVNNNEKKCVAVYYSTVSNQCENITILKYSPPVNFNVLSIKEENSWWYQWNIKIVYIDRHLIYIYDINTSHQCQIIHCLSQLQQNIIRTC